MKKHHPIPVLALGLMPCLTAAAVNYPPVAKPLKVYGYEDQALDFTLRATDRNGDPLTFNANPRSIHGGTLTVTGNQAHYVPPPDWHGVDQFEFRAHDGQNLSAPALASVVVRSINDPPSAQPATVAVARNTPATILLVATDADDDRLTFAIATPPTHGRVKINGRIATYTPFTGYSGPDNFAFTARDAKVLSPPATVDLNVDDSAAAYPPCRPWSSPTTWAAWGATVPQPGEAVTIPAGRCVQLNITPPALGGLTIAGRLQFADSTDIGLSAAWIMVSGELHIGSAQTPYRHRATLTFTGAPGEDIAGMGTRGLMVMGGVLELHGKAPNVAWTKLNAHAAANSDQLTLDRSVNWQAGDEIVIAPTDFYGVADTEARQLAAVAGQTLDLTAPLSSFHWGQLQYATTTGMSLVKENLVKPTANPTPVILDERAAVGNLSRNIVIQAPDDEAWQQQHFGAHLMIMELPPETSNGQRAKTHIEGVEFRRVGQQGILGRYPYHSHRRSYANDGSLLADVTGDYLRDSTIHQSANRCITIHATNGLTVSNNICYDIQGHGIFFEDAVERRNIVENNLILHVRNPAQEVALKLHECCSPGVRNGASGLWVSNPDNSVRRNHAGDAQGFGLWMAFPNHPVGLSHNVPLIPRWLKFGNFDDNTTHSNFHEGTMLDLPEDDDLGTISFQPITYISTLNGAIPVNHPLDPNELPFAIRRLSTWKNGQGALWNRVNFANYQEFVSADNQGRFFAGSGEFSDISRCLAVGTSLNNFTAPPNRSWLGEPVAFASYHSGFSIHDNIAINFPLPEGINNLVEGGRAGVFDTSDYYIRPVEKGLVRNTSNILINSHPGYRAGAFYPHYKLAGALWDPNGVWGPANNWFVYNDSFLTHNANCVPVEPVGQSGGVSCSGDYYGAEFFVLRTRTDTAEGPVYAQNADYDAQMPIHVTRYDEANPSQTVGEWTIASGVGQSPFQNMRHFAVRPNGIYLLDLYPGETVPDNLVGMSFRMTNMHTTTNSAVIGVRYVGNHPAEVTASSHPGYNGGYCQTTVCHSYTAVESLQAVIASSGETFWHDTVNQVVWAKVRGGLADAYAAPEDLLPFSEESLYRHFKLYVYDPTR